MTQRVTLKVNKELLEKIESHYAMYEKDNAGEYILFFAKNDTLTVTCYCSKKEDDFKVMFLGCDALDEARIWDPNAELNVSKKKVATKADWILLSDQIGSDEVGTGDFFGPICVCAAYVKKTDIKRLKELGVDDSKRLSDDSISEIAKKLINEIEYSQVSLPNEKYNELIDKGMNMNEIKAKMHNQVLLNLSNKNPKVKNIIQDQFLEEKKYYSYLKDTNEVVKGITFKTKGETYYPSVAVGSIIARYSFLQKMEAMKEKYGIEIPFGASNKVTEVAIKIAQEFGVEELNKIVKKNFANFSEVLASI